MKKALAVLFVSIMMLMGPYPARAGDGPKVKVVGADNTEYVLADFVFLSDHRSFEGQFYTPCSSSSDQGLIIHDGLKAYEIEGKDIKSINMSRPDLGHSFDGVTIETVNGKKYSGTVLIDSWYTWLVYSDFWCEGSVSVLGKKGTYNEVLGNIKSIANNPEQDGKFDIVDGEDHKTTVSDLHFGVTRVCPMSDLDIIGLSNEVGVVVDKVTVQVGVSEIKKVDFSNDQTLNIYLKSGESSKAKFETVTRIKGEISPGEFLFTPIFDNDGQPRIKSVVFDMPN